MFFKNFELKFISYYLVRLVSYIFYVQAISNDVFNGEHMKYANGVFPIGNTERKLNGTNVFQLNGTNVFQLNGTNVFQLNGTMCSS